MSRVWFTSDLHIGHNNIHKFRCKELGFKYDFTSSSDYEGWLFDHIFSKVSKRDTIYLLGDIAFTEEALLKIKTIPGRKLLVKGNHDINTLQKEIDVYGSILGLGRYKGCWLSHAPVHPDELRGRACIHGHVHYATIPDNRYFNCCVENLVALFDSPIVEFKHIKEHMENNK